MSTSNFPLRSSRLPATIHVLIIKLEINQTLKKRKIKKKKSYIELKKAGKTFHKKQWFSNPIKNVQCKIKWQKWEKKLQVARIELKN